MPAPTTGLDSVRRTVDAAHAIGVAEGSAEMHVVAWRDPVIDSLGYDPRSCYVECFWLGVLGPTSTWLMRRLVAGLDHRPDGFDLDSHDTARALGLGGRAGRHAPFRRAVARCVTFGMARDQGGNILAVRRRLPPLPRRHLIRLPVSIQEQHARWVDATKRTAPIEHIRRRSRRLALGLLEVEDDFQAVERRLVRWRVHPALAHEAVGWALAVRMGADEAGAGSPAPQRQHNPRDSDAKATTDGARVPPAKGDRTRPSRLSVAGSVAVPRP